MMVQEFLKNSRILLIRFAVFPLLLMAVSSCAFISQIRSARSLSNAETQPIRPTNISYSFVDQAGEFYFQRESGFQQSTNQMIVKEQILTDNRDSSKPFERSVTISQLGSLNNTRILRPSVSQFSVWFDGERYFTEMKLNSDKQGLDIELKSPESKWQGKKFERFPDGNGHYCFFSQVIECARVTGFIDKAVELSSGRMSFHIIWEGYPYVQEQYPGVPNQVFTQAVLAHDGLSDTGEHRFSLTFGGQTIFYHLNENRGMEKMFWVAQGLSVTPI